ncbi:hypothetical protein Hanom_Chr07g00663841 [Helianthus anomalus]
MGGVGLGLVADDSQDGDIKEEEGSNELGNDGSVKRPLGELFRVEEVSRWRVLVIFCTILMASNFNVFAHC